MADRPRSGLPRVMQASTTMEQRFGPRLTVSSDYTFQRGTHLFRARDLNEPLPGTSVRPVPGFGNLDQIETSSWSRNHNLTVTVRSKVSERFTLTAQYVWSRLRDDTSGFLALPSSSYDLRPEWGAIFE